ncbi:MAG TPA: T9SS type A sorting domain-containing protein [Bacteroidia bacterium]|nr:T9SS type A sorting domain-containing protein [Bacteroidia bacterium]
MKTIAPVISILLILAQGVFAQQQFQMLLHPGIAQEAKFMSKANITGYLLASDYTDMTGEKSILLTRLDDQFNIIWHNEIGVPGIEEHVNSFYQDSIGNIFIAGYVKDSLATPMFNMLVIKTDSSGNLIWNKVLSYGIYNSLAQRILETSTGSVYVLGGSDDDVGGFPAYMTAMIKLNPSGTLLWSYTYPSSYHNNSSIKMLPSADGNFVACYESSALNDESVGITKFDTTGTKTWDNRWWISGNNNFPIGTMDDITFSGNGGYALFGTRGIDTTWVFKNYIMKCDSSGNQLQQNLYGIIYNNYIGTSFFQKSVHTSDGGYAIAGLISDTLLTYRIGLMKVDSNLVPQWCRLYDINPVFDMASLLQTPDGGFIISATRNNNILLIKTDSLGFSLCNEQTLGVYYWQEPIALPNHLSGYQLPSFIPLAYSPSVSLIANAGDTVCYTITAVSENDHTKSVSVFPNPFTSEFSVTIYHERSGQKATNGSFAVKTILGKTVFYKEENDLAEAHTEKIDLKNLSPGIYFVEILLDKERTVKKIIKQ